MACFQNVEVLDALKLSPEQAEAIENASRKMFARGLLRRMEDETLATLLENLNPAQKISWKELSRQAI